MDITSDISGNELVAEFVEYLQGFANFDHDSLQMLLEVLKVKKLLKHENLVEHGEVCKRVVFFTKGYFRFYHFHENGSEVTNDFYFAPGFVTSYTSLITQKPSFVNVQAMETMEVLEISRNDIYNLYDKNVGVERLGRLLAESIAMNSEKHLFLLLNQTAETRYRNLLAEYPRYVHHIPLQYIASFFCITKESLIRIRKSMM